MNQFSNPWRDRTPFEVRSPRTGWVVTALAALLVSAGCSTQRLAQPAPVEDRSAVRPTVKVLPGAENAGKPVFY